MTTPSWLPGLGVAGALGLVATGFEPVTHHSIPGLDPITAALLAGVVLGNVLGPRPSWAPGTRLAGGPLLSLAVVLLGASLDLLGLGALDWTAWAGVLAAMGLVLATGGPLGRLLGLRSPSAFLVAAGTAICGSSAIAAVAPMVRDKSDTDVGISVAVVNLLGAGFMVLLPPLFAALALAPEDSAVLLGGSLQAVGHVVGAASGLEGGHLETATAVKMARVALLVPFVLVLGLRQPKPEDPEHRRRGPRLPLYLVGFIAMSALGTAGLLSPDLAATLKSLAKLLLAVAMAGIGLSIRVTMLRAAGPRALLLGLGLFVLQLGGTGLGLFLGSR